MEVEFNSSPLAVSIWIVSKNALTFEIKIVSAIAYICLGRLHVIERAIPRGDLTIEGKPWTMALKFCFSFCEARTTATLSTKDDPQYICNGSSKKIPEQYKNDRGSERGCALYKFWKGTCSRAYSCVAPARIKAFRFLWIFFELSLEYRAKPCCSSSLCILPLQLILQLVESRFQFKSAFVACSATQYLYRPTPAAKILKSIRVKIWIRFCLRKNRMLNKHTGFTGVKVKWIKATMCYIY